jgi:hypothetical protein
MGGDPISLTDPLRLAWCSFSPVGCEEAQKVTCTVNPLLAFPYI